MKKQIIYLCFLFILSLPFLLFGHQDAVFLSLECLEQLKKLNGSLDIIDGFVQISPDIKVQANKFSIITDEYSQKNNCRLQAFGNIIVFYRNYTFVCDSLDYNQATKTCSLQNAKFASFPWFLGGKCVLITPEKITVQQGYISTSEGNRKDIVLSSKKIIVSSDNVLKLKTPTFKIKNIPLLVFPSCSMNIEHITRPPFNFHFGTGGYLGTYAGVTYYPINSKTFLLSTRLDGFFTHGIGFGVNINYNPSPALLDSYGKQKNYLDLKNYYVHKLPINTKLAHDRYRYQGRFSYLSSCSQSKVEGNYDITDSWETVGDLFLNQFNLPNVDPSKISFTQTNAYCNTKVETKVKTNSFLSVNERLPSLHVRQVPILVNKQFFIQNEATLGFLKYSFSDVMTNISAFESLRASWTSSFFKPVPLYKLGTLTPCLTGKTIFYSESQSSNTQELFVGSFALKYNLLLIKKFSKIKHILEPFVHYNVVSKPTIINNDHFIFTINDGFYAVNMLSLGMYNYILPLSGNSYPSSLKLWSNFIFRNKNTQTLFPKLYLDCSLQITPKLKCKLQNAWIIQKSTWDHCNFSCQWAKNETLAISTEFFHRSKYGWKKSDPDNFMIDCAYSERSFLSSSLSERRNTLLTKLFIQPHPLLFYKFSLRYGWLNKFFNNYLEYEMTLGSKIFDHWNINAVYEKRENDKRFYCSLRLDVKPKSAKNK